MNIVYTQLSVWTHTHTHTHFFMWMIKYFTVYKHTTGGSNLAIQAKYYKFFLYNTNSLLYSPILPLINSNLLTLYVAFHFDIIIF